MDEAKAFGDALAARSPEDPTACRDWLVRDVVAHLAAGAQEESDLIEAALRGEPSRATRPFEEREAACRALPYQRLLSALIRESARLHAAVDALSRSGRTVEFTGVSLTAEEFRMHSRSELALHRWDIVGDDTIGQELLAQPELTTHAVKVLSGMTSLQESAAARVVRSHGVPDRFAFRLRVPGTDDVLVRMAPVPSLELSLAADDAAVVRCSAADRLLLLWGRRPDRFRLDASAVPAPERGLIDAFLSV